MGKVQVYVLPLYRYSNISIIPLQTSCNHIQLTEVPLSGDLCTLQNTECNVYSDSNGIAKSETNKKNKYNFDTWPAYEKGEKVIKVSIVYTCILSVLFTHCTRTTGSNL